MRLPPRLPLALLAALLLAGCSTPPPAPTPDGGPVTLPADELGVFLVDLEAGTALAVSPRTLGWMSPSGDILVWEGEEAYFVLSIRSRQSVDFAAEVLWSRIEDDGSGIRMEPGRAVRALLTNGTDLQTFPLPRGPRPDGSWSGGSANFTVLGAEWPGVTGGAGCQNALAVLDTGSGGNLTRAGCHLRVARDGRVGWTEATGVWVREANGDVRDITGTGRDVNGTFVAHENPVFTSDEVVFLRLSGGERLTRTEVVDERGEVLARLEGERRIALLDASADGSALLLRIFER